MKIPEGFILEDEQQEVSAGGIPPGWVLVQPDEPAPVEQPEPEFPVQHQEQPGLEAELDPAPRWKGERYRPADKLKDMVALVTGR